MKVLLGMFALLVVVASACDNNRDFVLPTGQKFSLVDDQSGAVPTDSQLVYFQVSVYEGDSLLQSTYETTGKPERAIMYPIDTTKGPENIFITALRRMSAGDSATLSDRVRRPADETGAAYAATDSMDISYRIRVTKIEDIAAGIAFRDEMIAEQKRQQAEQQEMMLAYQAREGSVTDSIKAEIKAFKSMGAKAAGYTTTASGLNYKIIKPGMGPQPNVGNMVYVSYLGALMDGTVFDNTFERAQPFDFKLGTGGVIPGWDEGVALMSPGAQAVFMIPANLAYGPEKQGPIPANAPLVFFVELLGVMPGGPE